MNSDKVLPFTAVGKGGGKSTLARELAGVAERPGRLIDTTDVPLLGRRAAMKAKLGTVFRAAWDGGKLWIVREDAVCRLPRTTEQIEAKLEEWLNATLQQNLMRVGESQKAGLRWALAGRQLTITTQSLKGDLSISRMLDVVAVAMAQLDLITITVDELLVELAAAETRIEAEIDRRALEGTDTRIAEPAGVLAGEAERGRAGGDE